MPAKKFTVALTSEERQKLDIVARSQRHSLRERTRAHILLLADSGREGASQKDAEIARQVRCQPLTVAQVRERAAVRGVLEAIRHKPQERRKARALDGEQEAHLVALTCSAPPEGRRRWTLRLLKDRLIAMEIVEDIGCETIRRTLKKTR
jgi:hypothetical protein